ncbi:MAG TPA: YkvA family protein [Candidatus Nanopelagicales bacterium]|nr:YkvA family protein [Candidatus Nanopelagicales bacterium]
MSVAVTVEDPPGGDPFPRVRFVALVGRLPRYLRLAWALAGEPRLSRTRKAGVLAAAAYLASPVDLVPGIIPVVGQLDDVAVTLLALRAALRALDPATRERHLAAAGLAPGDMDQDLGTLAATAGWLARRGIAVGRRLAILAAAASLAAGRAGAGAFRRGAPVVARSGGRLARTTGGVLARAGVRGRVAVGKRLHRGHGDDAPDEGAPLRNDEPGPEPGAERG